MAEEFSANSDHAPDVEIGDGFQVSRSIEREALNVVQELCQLSAHTCSKVLGVLLEFYDGRTQNTPSPGEPRLLPRA